MKTSGNAIVLIVGVGLVLSMAESAVAQRRGQGGLRLGEATSTQLLQIAAVQNELKITDEQKTKAAAVNETVTSGRRQIFAANSKDSKERAPKVAELNKQADAEIEKILNDAQNKRLKQIVLQANGAAELQKDEIQKALSFTEEQKSQIAEIRKENLKARRDGLAQLQGAARSTKDAELYREADKKLLKVLRSDQSKQFEQMQGEKIKLDLVPSAPGG